MAYTTFVSILVTVVAALSATMPVRNEHTMSSTLMMQMAFQETSKHFDRSTATAFLAHMRVCEQNDIGAATAAMSAQEAASYTSFIEASSAYMLGFQIQPTPHRGPSVEDNVANLLTTVSVVVKRVRAASWWCVQHAGVWVLVVVCTACWCVGARGGVWVLVVVCGCSWWCVGAPQLRVSHLPCTQGTWLYTSPMSASYVKKSKIVAVSVLVYSALLAISCGMDPFVQRAAPNVQFFLSPYTVSCTSPSIDTFVHTIMRAQNNHDISSTIASGIIQLFSVPVSQSRLAGMIWHQPTV